MQFQWIACWAVLCFTTCVADLHASSHRLDSLSALTQTTLKTDPQKAMGMAGETAELARIAGDSTIWALSLKQQGIACFYQGKYGEAMGSYEKALALYAEIGDILGQWACQNNIAIVYQDLGEQDLSLQAHLSALELAKEGQLTAKLAVSLANMSNVLVDLKDYHGAIAGFREALALHEISENPTGIIQCLTGIASVYTEQARFDSALYYRGLAWPLLARHGTVRDVVPFHINLASALGHEGLYDSAAVHLLAAEKDLHRVEPRNQVHFYNVRGWLAQWQGRYREAQKMYALGFELSQTHNLAYQANWLRLDMARNLQLLGRHKAAFDSLMVYAEEQAAMTQLSSEAFMENVTARFAAQQERDSLAQLQTLTILESEASAAKLATSRFKLVLVLVIAGFLVAALLIGLLFVRYRNQQKQLIEKAKRIEIQHRLLRAHMAPHFLYNSMNAIQHFIGQNDTFQAEVYLAKFARLMRTNLNHTRAARIPLGEELEALQNYIELEQFRFEGKFIFKVEVAPEVDLELISVPPLLLQPHVENAILHGLRPLTSEGQLLVKVGETGAQLVIIVEDNGIGRAAAKARKKTNPILHDSLALDIIGERLAGLNQSLGREAYRQEVADLHDASGQATGTRVTHYYPI